MRPNEDNPESRDSRRSGRFGLFFYEQVGSRYYLRFTGLALFLIVCLTVVSIILIFSLFLWNRTSSPENINVNITVPSPTPHNDEQPIIQPAPSAPKLPKVVRQPRPVMPTPQLPSAPAGNDSRPATPSPTPVPSAARTPT